MPIAAAPVIAAMIGAGATVGSTAYAAHKAQKTAKQAMQPAQMMAQLALSRSNTLFGEGLPLIGQASNYWQRLMGGSRAAMRQATAGPAASIRDTYAGAERGLEHAGVRGAAKDVASADLGRQKAGQISSLISGVQPQAASALTDIGTNLVAGSGTNLSQAGNMFSNLLGYQQQQGQINFNQGQQSGNAIGGLLASLLPLLQKKGGGYDSTTNIATGPAQYGGYNNEDY